ncbi:MAG: 2-hydroxychromene-2-carboxylate isomerase [Ramlibacter sp.]
MSPTIDYYFAPQSPWTYLGHDRFVTIARAAGATVRVLPADLGAVFSVSGGLPLGKRAPQRQAYRLVELRRFSQHLGLPMNIQPQYFPVAGDDAARLIITVNQHDGTDAALAISGAIFRACWAQQRNMADADTLAALLAECNLPAQRLAQSRGADVQEVYEANTRQAIDAGVFGAPSYVVNGEIFWGQDRLDFLERHLNNQGA